MGTSIALFLCAPPPLRGIFLDPPLQHRVCALPMQFFGRNGYGQKGIRPICRVQICSSAGGGRTSGGNVYKNDRRVHSANRRGTTLRRRSHDVFVQALSAEREHGGTSSCCTRRRTARPFVERMSQTPITRETLNETVSRSQCGVFTTEGTQVAYAVLYWR